MCVNNLDGLYMKHDYLTVVSVVGHESGEESLPALKKSMEYLKGSKGLLISAIKPSYLPNGIEWTKILPLDYRLYSLFLMFSLHHFIKTEFCLIVQPDGWIINEKNWKEEFLNYDYIGAPCHAAFIENKLIQNYKWVTNYSNDTKIIQNGGFSLRSKKLLESPSKFGAMYHYTDVTDFQNEDVQLTGIFKSQLEELGINFAPIHLAKNFSLEYIGPYFHDDLSLNSLFGIHGKTRQLIDENTIKITVTEKEVDYIFREKELLDFLKYELGYKIIYKLEKTNISSV